jgi:RNA polymerase sigma factor (sigma-70 family)
MDEMDDGALLAAARGGDQYAYGRLYVRHAPAAIAVARSLARSGADTDDVVSEAFARVLRALLGGGGPESAFRPYLLATVRHVFLDRVRAVREEPTDDLGDRPIDAARDASSREDRRFAMSAFASLPERWQQVLWQTEVEGRRVSEVAPMLGLRPPAVAALAYRAREGLRQAYLQAHLAPQRSPACRACVDDLGAYVRDGLAPRDRRRIDQHLTECPSCLRIAEELTDTNSSLRAGAGRYA